jgi:hypothetical protein
MAKIGQKLAKPARHASVLALLKAYPNERWPKRIIKRLAVNRLADARTKGWGADGPPFCPKVLSSLYGIRCKEVNHDIGGEGRILPDPNRENRAMIEYLAGRMEERQRFTIFHEFAHTLFPDYCVLKTYHQAASVEKDPEIEFEGLCDVAAAEFIMPEDLILSDLAGKRVSGEIIGELRKRYHASLDASVRRVVELTSSVACGAIFLKAPGPGTSREVSYSLKNGLFSGFIRAGSKISWSGNLNAPQKTTLFIDGRPRSYRVESLNLPSVPDNLSYPTNVLLLLPSSY